MPKKTILKMVAEKYPEMDPALALQAIYRKQGDIYEVAELLGCSPSGVWRVIEKIEMQQMINGNNGG